MSKRLAWPNGYLDVSTMLRRIAKSGMPRRWVGFDDAEIGDFLRANRRASGRNITKLRLEYEEAMGPQDVCTITFWPFTKTQAKALLREVGQAK